MSEFDDLYRRHAPAAFRRARRLLGADADAQRIVHDVFLALCERPEEYRGQGRMSAFLYGAVTHACIARLRKQRSATDTQASTRSPARASQNHVLLRPLLSRMPQALADVAVYYYMDELTQDEIALVLGSSREHAGDQIERVSTWVRSEDAAS